MSCFTGATRTRGAALSSPIMSLYAFREADSGLLVSASFQFAYSAALCQVHLGKSDVGNGGRGVVWWTFSDNSPKAPDKDGQFWTAGR